MGGLIDGRRLPICIPLYDMPPLTPYMGDGIILMSMVVRDPLKQFQCLLELLRTQLIPKKTLFFSGFGSEFTRRKKLEKI